ncbi:MAG: Superoxide dismutase [Parcubacteria group bacterium GW2011_GWA2_42_11]|nr:MAG: Superoxide dismutase [Parcubacteria group bacterium GW2011_GWA2_42_11]
MKFELPKLPYAYDALEPYFDAQTMEIHYSKHHQAYLDKLNAALADYPEFQDKTIEELLTGLDALPDKIRTAVKNNGGGHYSHSLFWQILKSGSGEPTGDLAAAIDKKFGNFDKFKKEFSDASKNFFGSGWCWLVLDKNKELEIITLPNHDCPITSGRQPLLVLDLWEHAYYLKYQNRRAEYVEAWWNVVNWEAAGKKLKE